MFCVSYHKAIGFHLLEKLIPDLHNLLYLYSKTPSTYTPLQGKGSTYLMCAQYLIIFKQYTDSFYRTLFRSKQIIKETFDNK